MNRKYFKKKIETKLSGISENDVLPVFFFWLTLKKLTSQIYLLAKHKIKLLVYSENHLQLVSLFFLWLNAFVKLRIMKQK